eukprot:1181405-Prorocentrum_minimum.AAC.4
MMSEKTPLHSAPLPCRPGNTQEWEVAAPWTIPTATILGLMGTVTTLTARWDGLWQIYGRAMACVPLGHPAGSVHAVHGLAAIGAFLP